MTLNTDVLDSTAADTGACASRTEEEEEDDAWALELEEELDLGGISKDEPPAIPGASTKVSTHSLAGDLPQEVLINIMSFGQVGRVSKAWSLAMSTLARRKFSTRLTDILREETDDALAVAQEVENALFDLHGQPYTLPKAYGQKARQLLFNLKDSRNALLRDRLLSGELTAHALVRMSATDMANPQLVRQRKEWIKKRTHEVMRESQELSGFTESDMFECRSCGSSRTRYRQWRRKAIVDRVRIIIICLRCPYRWEL